MSRAFVLRSRALLVTALGASLVAASCADEPDGIGTGGGAAHGTPVTATGGQAGAGGGPDATPTGLPCDVAAVLAARCTSCHSDPPRSNAPQPLITRAHLLAPSVVDPTLSYAERAVLRMRAGTMPAIGGAEADADVIDAWLAAGTPDGGCGEGGGGGGIPDDPFAEPSSCVSGETWDEDADEGEDMHPGRTCIACHAEERAEGEDDAPFLAIGGTVYPNGHSPDDCFGIDGSSSPYAAIEVWITDSTGAEIRLDVGPTGNFLLDEDEGLVPPFHAKVVDLSVDPPRERVMVEEQTSGDCNACHTEDGGGDGSDAPGRILVP